jgi:SNF2 family DNA or RNA helicase
MLCREDLHEYQRRGVDFILDKKRVFMLLDMGLGKTVTTLTAITDLIDSFSINKVLVISPLRVANSVWPTEVNEWSHLSHLKVNIATGSEKNRISALSTTCDIVSINRENIKWLVDYYGKGWPFDCVVVDESSSFKNNGSQRFKSIKKILPSTEYMIALTGTPSPNGLLDLWSQVFLIDFGIALGRTMTAYKKRFFESDFMGYKFEPKSGSSEKIHDLIRPFTLSMSAADYLEVPDRIDSVLPVRLPPKIMAEYFEFQKELISYIQGEELEAQSAAVLANKLLQWCNGATYTDEFKNWITLHDVKLKTLGELIEENEGENILVAYNFKTDLIRLQKAFPDGVVLDKEQSTIDSWNKGDIKLMFAHPASAGHGLNLQKGGSMIVWFGLNWSLELYQQFNGRLHRQGQTKPVRVVHIVAEGCIDERVMEVLSNKDATQKDLLQSLTGQITKA